ncbi:hypothetical protein CEXT_165961 [Caerostris extrusa]|uniref:Uncharacterized protein n=1 Tax=Caerostris extrusa TaxID=172846 RepID=A0AAV4UY99_CAEEX|nr:hypothetical protein CEXT_165961 [Caerostris extrusa]
MSTINPPEVKPRVCRMRGQLSIRFHQYKQALWGVRFMYVNNQLQTKEWKLQFASDRDGSRQQSDVKKEREEKCVL